MLFLYKYQIHFGGHTTTIVDTQLKTDKIACFISQSSFFDWPQCGPILNKMKQADLFVLGFDLCCCCKGTPCVFLAHLGCDAVPLRAGEVVGPAPDLGVQLLLVFIPEGRVTHQQDVEDHTWGSEHYHPDKYPCPD